MSTTRPYHHGNLRAALLEAAEEALARGGVDDLSLRDLARRIGVSHAAPRRHFADRRALLDALAANGFERLGAAMRAVVEDGADFRSRLSALALVYVGFATEHAALLELMYARKHRAGAAGVQDAAARAFAAPIELIAQGQAAGEVVPGDPERLAPVVFATIHGLAALAIGGLLDGWPLPALVDEATGRIVDGLAPRD